MSNITNATINLIGLDEQGNEVWLDCNLAMFERFSHLVRMASYESFTNPKGIDFPSGYHLGGSIFSISGRNAFDNNLSWDATKDYLRELKQISHYYTLNLNHLIIEYVDYDQAINWGEIGVVTFNLKDLNAIPDKKFKQFSINKLAGVIGLNVTYDDYVKDAVDENDEFNKSCAFYEVLDDAIFNFVSNRGQYEEILNNSIEMDR